MLVGNYNLPSLDATGLDVIIIGGGDTGVDCIGTSLRQVYPTAATLILRLFPASKYKIFTPV